MYNNGGKNNKDKNGKNKYRWMMNSVVDRNKV